MFTDHFQRSSFPSGKFVRVLATAYYQLLPESTGIPAETFGRVARIKCKKGNHFCSSILNLWKTLKTSDQSKRQLIIFLIVSEVLRLCQRFLSTHITLCQISTLWESPFYLKNQHSNLKLMWSHDEWIRYIVFLYIWLFQFVTMPGLRVDTNICEPIMWFIFNLQRKINN